MFLYRTFYHSQSMRPYQPNEFDEPSEDEDSYEWVTQRNEAVSVCMYICVDRMLLTKPTLLIR
jgi:hypothetical protein